jgi:hypothetical protein
VIVIVTAGEFVTVKEACTVRLAAPVALNVIVQV